MKFLRHRTFWKYLYVSDVAFQDRIKWFSKIFPQGSKSVLDVGCGIGVATAVASQKGWKATGLDHNEKELAIAQKIATSLRLKKCHFVQHDVRKLSSAFPKSKKFDTIICLEVIEHILDDQKIFTMISNLLEKNGRLYLSTPNKYYRHLVGDHLSTVENGDHVRWGYTFEDLNKLAANAGLQVIDQGMFCGFAVQMLDNLQRLLSIKISSKLAWALTFPLRIFLFLDFPFTKLLHYPYLSVYIVAVKK